MNERIRELQHQCWVKVPCDFDMRKGGLSTINTVFDYEKFAELIVRECIKVIETNHPEFDCKESADNLIRRAGRMDAMDEISNHFEVEL